LWLTALSIVLGFITAYAALHSAGDVLVYVLLFMFGGLLGYLGPQSPWRWALVLGIWVPIAEIVSRASALIGTPPAGQILQPLIALVPPFLGVYAGMIFHRWVPPPPPPPEEE
jgi:hypothetical protein